MDQQQDSVSRRCPRCGQEVNAGATLCGNCWTKFETPASSGVELTPIRTHESSRPAIPFAAVGFFLGGVVGFLTRPSAFLIGQLPFSTVISRGGTLSGLDKILIPTAQASFNQIMFLAVLGAAIGFAVPWALTLYREEPRVPMVRTGITHSPRYVESAVGPNAEMLDNDAVLTMLAAGLGDDIVIAKMNRSRCQFALSSSDLAQLKQRGASDRVIAAMLQSLSTHDTTA